MRQRIGGWPGIELPCPGTILSDGTVSSSQSRRMNVALMLPDLEILLEIMYEDMENLPGDEPVEQLVGNEPEQGIDLLWMRDLV